MQRVKTCKRNQQETEEPDRGAQERVNPEVYQEQQKKAYLNKGAAKFVTTKGIFVVY